MKTLTIILIIIGVLILTFVLSVVITLIILYPTIKDLANINYIPEDDE